ncbi:MAG TPA: hypothetical protein VMT16_01050, partial [Thermoanaerobaculia bacterium]|nr:hypothetical protein [Thermoanaerobaculia bacterium]
SDLFSLGAALWEAAAGEAPFRRATAAETMTAILREEPAEPADTGRRLPPELERVLRHCLEKRPEERFQSARDLAFDLGRLQEGSAATAAQRPVLARAAQRRRWLVPAAVLLLAAFAAGWLVARRTAAPAAPPVKVRPLTFSGQDFTPTASADGRLVAFTSQRDGRPRIWLLDLVTGGEQPLTAGPDHFAAFSPDGSSILFRRDREDGGDLYRQSLVGGQLHRVVGDALAGVWSPDGARLAFVRARRGDGGDVVSSLFTADAAGRGETLLAEVPREAITAPRFSPDGSRLVATVLSASNLALGGRFIVVDVATGAVRDVQPPRRAILSSAVWSADGRELLYAFSEETTAGISGGNNLAVWQPLRGGSPRPQFWLRDLFGGGAVGSGRMAPAGPGRLVFEARVLRASLQELPLDSLAGAGSPRSLTAGASVDRQPVYSPDGGTLLFSSNRGGNLDLWQLALDSGALRRVTDDPAADWDPAFSPDGSAILWSSDRGGNLEVWMANADGSGARQVTRDGVDAENPTMTADGQWIVYASGNAAHPGVWKVRPDGSEATRLYGGNVFIPEVSPDGRHALFVEARPYAASNRLRALEVGSGRLLDFQVEVPRGASATGTLAENAGRPRWVDDGRIAFTGARPDGGLAVFVQDFRPGRDTSASRMEVSGPKREAGAESFDVSPDGRRLTVAWLQEERTVMLAEGVPGVGEER